MPDLSHHYVTRNSWLRAAVMGANDGIISTSGLLVGVAVAGADSHTIFVTGMAGLVAGASSMAAGEYVSVSSQADMEKADLLREAEALSNDFEKEEAELIALYQARGLSSDLATQVAKQLMTNAPLETHAREELGILEHNQAKPLQAAFSSAVAFISGAIIPIIAAVFSSADNIVTNIGSWTLISLIALGYASAKMGGASPRKAIARILVWGSLALLFGALVGQLFGQGQSGF